MQTEQPTATDNGTRPVGQRDGCLMSRLCRKTANYCRARTESVQTPERRFMKKGIVYQLRGGELSDVNYENDSFDNQ